MSCVARATPWAAGAAWTVSSTASAVSSGVALRTARRSSGAVHVQRDGRWASQTARSMLLASARRLLGALICRARSPSSRSHEGSAPAARRPSSLPRRMYTRARSDSGACGSGRRGGAAPKRAGAAMVALSTAGREGRVKIRRSCIKIPSRPTVPSAAKRSLRMIRDAEDLRLVIAGEDALAFSWVWIPHASLKPGNARPVVRRNRRA
jgi:hypothetical protein